MSQRYRITRSLKETGNVQDMTLDECKQLFATKPDFEYTSVFTVKGTESTMSIEGDFFMWSYGEAKIPFRLYSGDLYVAVSNEAVVPKMIEIASELEADIVEG
ncbi:hypothetical protein PghCCS26_15360 [Paenibacillus glycanilyticus]|uniref:Uncharacterized protein n=1 Tax=Paenibacillus glycanilyticus TaxID=126569 RepID=A0ABQ6NIP1_9BACL|nr:hypothetical protein [Paenibacillus glycanilyticus]GMK44408.1 hypothetical protein PghCCS26_15360 [Paenibacillus glycanilyticus]